MSFDVLTHRLTSILVVDDSPLHRGHAVDLCRELGIAQVHEAGDGEVALSLLCSLRPAPQVMILDIEMPGMNGVELMEALRVRNVAVALIVASGREGAMIDSVQAIGASLGFQVLAGLEKPLSLKALGNALGMLPCGMPLPKAPAARALPTIRPDVLEAALEAGQITVHYQPKVDIQTAAVHGVEALVRWTHPTLGAIAPTYFVGLAEQYGLIQPLTFHVLAHALAQAANWRNQGTPLPVAVNLSPRLLDWPGLAQEIVALAQRYQVPFEQVSFEITESSVVGSDGAARGLLARLRLRGFGLSIDDYGTGFSSMQQLSRIPFTELKIDRSFVRGATERKSLRVILKAAIDMASQLGLVSTAEGIETLEEWRLLQALGCGVGQGYFLGMPMPAGEIAGWLDEHAARADMLRACADDAVPL